MGAVQLAGDASVGQRPPTDRSRGEPRGRLLPDHSSIPTLERAIGDAVEGEEVGWCYYLDAEFSENEDDPDWEADELLKWR